MKKLTILLATAVLFSTIACNNEKKEEQPNVEQAIEQMTQALDTSNVVAPVADTTAPAH